MTYYFWIALFFFILYLVFAIKERHGDYIFDIEDWFSILFASAFWFVSLFFIIFGNYRVVKKVQVK